MKQPDPAVVVPEIRNDREPGEPRDVPEARAERHVVTVHRLVPAERFVDREQHQPQPHGDEEFEVGGPPGPVHQQVRRHESQHGQAVPEWRFECALVVGESAAQRRHC